MATTVIAPQILTTAQEAPTMTNNLMPVVIAVAPGP